jgi:chromosome partitioning protein
MKVLTVINHKGGVGKTTTAVHLAKSLSLMGHKALVVDFDPQANASIHLGIEEADKTISDAILRQEDLTLVEISENLWLVPGALDLATAEKEFAGSITAYIKLKKAIEKVRGQFDYVLIDCPPSLGFFTLNALNASTDALIITNPTKLAIQGIETIINTIEDVQSINPDLKVNGIVIADAEKLVSATVVEEYLRDGEIKVFDTVVRHYKHYKEASMVGQTVHDYAPDHQSVKDYDNLAKEIVNE